MKKRSVFCKLGPKEIKKTRKMVRETNIKIDLVRNVLGQIVKIN